VKEFSGEHLRVLVVWEPVLPTDWFAPSTAALRRLSDPRAIQFWDKGRLLSHAMGEHDKHSIVWDQIRVYERGAAWQQVPPEPFYSGGPVLNVIEPARTGIKRAFVSPYRRANSLTSASDTLLAGLMFH
jgi:hypothetical protein